MKEEGEEEEKEMEGKREGQRRREDAWGRRRETTMAGKMAATEEPGLWHRPRGIQKPADW